MPLTNAGLAFIPNAVANNGSPDFFTNSNAYLGVGDDNTAFSAAHTDLQASTNKLRKAMEASYPQVSTYDLIFRSLFGTGEGNFPWEEWGVFNASSGGTMLSRKVESLGTKTSASSWQLTATLTFGIGS